MNTSILKLHSCSIVQGKLFLRTLAVLILQDMCAGLAWALQRVESAPLLRISLLDHENKYTRTEPGKLRRLVGALIPASRDIRDVRVLVSALFGPLDKPCMDNNNARPAIVMILAA